MPDCVRQQLKSKPQMLLEQLSASPCFYTEFDTLLMLAMSAAIPDGCLRINERQKPVLSSAKCYPHLILTSSLAQRAF